MQNLSRPYAQSSNYDCSHMLKQEQEQSLYTSLPVSLLSSAIIAIILAVSHWEIIGRGEVIIWALFMGATLVVRLTLWIFWKNARQLYSPHFWVRFFRLGTWFSGAAWGAAAFLLFAEDNALYQALLAFSLAGVASGSTTSLTADKYSSVGFVVLAISPLSVFIFLEEGPTALAMSSMTLLFIFFVITSSNRTRRNMEDHIHKNEHLVKLTTELNDKQQLEKIINNAQSTFINNNDAKSALQTLLLDTLSVSKSKLGFIGQVEHDKHGQLFMRALVFGSTKKQDPYLERFRAKQLPPNGEYRNLNNLFGLALHSDKPVISHDFKNDNRTSALPADHPEIKNFIAIPIFTGKQQTAILGLANSPTEYQEQDAEKLTAILKTIAQFVQTLNHERRHAQDRAALETTTHQTQAILNDIADGIITLDQSGRILSLNHAAEIIFGYRSNQILGKNFSELMPLPYKFVHEEYIRSTANAGKKIIPSLNRKLVGLRRNGRQFPLDLLMSRLEQQDEPVFVITVRDISEKKRADESRTRFIHDVEQKVAKPLKVVAEAITCLKNCESNFQNDEADRLLSIADVSCARIQKSMQDLFQPNLLTAVVGRRMVTTSIQKTLERALERVRDFADIYKICINHSGADESLLIKTDPQIFNLAIDQFLICAFRASASQSVVTLSSKAVNQSVSIFIQFSAKIVPNAFHNNLELAAETAEPKQDLTVLNQSPEWTKDESWLVAKSAMEKMGGTVVASEEAGRAQVVINFAHVETLHESTHKKTAP